MHRTLKRIVKVVTTTSWIIRWEADPPEPGDPADSSNQPPEARLLFETAVASPGSALPDPPEENPAADLLQAQPPTNTLPATNADTNLSNPQETKNENSA